MSPSSSPSEGLLGLFARGAVAAQVSDAAWVQALLDVEAALARASARVGLVPPEAAEAISERARSAVVDAAAIGREAVAVGNPVEPLVRALVAQLPEDAARHVHRGATSQDVLDTASMLVARRALAPLVEELAAAADACARLAREHRATPIAARTLLQQALPTTFGLKAAVWLVGLDEARALLDDVRARQLAVQLGGAGGTLSSLGDRGPEVAQALAEELELAEPLLPWHTVRVRPAALAARLGIAAGVLGKIARDVVLLAQTEVAEVAEPSGGGSSALPQKRNPVRAVIALACAQRTPGLVATILAAMPQEHERAAGGWQAEWETLRDLFRLAGTAAVSMRESLDELRIDPARMRANLDATGGLVLAESVATALAEHVGRPTAHDVVTAAAARSVTESRPFRDVLLEVPEIERALGADGVDAALDPARSLGAAEALVDRALAARG